MQITREFHFGAGRVRTHLVARHYSPGLDSRPPNSLVDVRTNPPLLLGDDDVIQTTLAAAGHFKKIEVSLFFLDGPTRCVSSPMNGFYFLGFSDNISLHLFHVGHSGRIRDFWNFFSKLISSRPIHSLLLHYNMLFSGVMLPTMPSMTDRRKERQGSFAKRWRSSSIGRWPFLDDSNKPECVPFEHGSDHVVNNAVSSTAADNNQPGESLLLRTNERTYGLAGWLAGCRLSGRLFPHQ